ncbi:MAG: ATP-binding protein [Steroidobacterales bacterium]
MDILELLPDAIFIIDNVAANGRIRYANPQALRMFGYERDALIGQPIDLLVPPRLRDQHLRHRLDFAMAPRLRTMGAGLVLHGCRRDGTEFPVDVQLNSRTDGADPVTIAIVRDVTERARLEEAFTQARDSAIRANETKSRFLAAASHDLRQPLQTIWSLQSILSRAITDVSLAPHLEELEEAVRNMDQILSSLIDINRLERGAIQPVIRDFPLQEILPRLRSEFGYFAASKSLRLDVEESTEFASSDPILLPVILRNLLGNAIKYTQHGSVRLRARVCDSNLCIDVIDTGPGIPREHRERLFDAFYQIDNPTRDQRNGVGLGLSIVQTICRLLDHKITLESSMGQGSTFTVHVPRGMVVTRTAEPAATSPYVAAAPSKRITVLHIEDDPGVARSISMFLRLEGYEVICAASRDEAIQQVDVHRLRPDLILCDYQLPLGYTGDEIIAELATKLAVKPPAIMLTGDISDAHVKKARAVVDRVLPKPVDANLLLQEIVALLARPG